MTQSVPAILIGAGQRGADAYGPYALQYPDQIYFVAVAEPDAERRERFATQHHIPPENRFETWQPLLEKPRLGAAALVCTQDQMHTQPTIAALKAGYHVLLEKPMATTLDECRQLVAAAEETGRQLHICHVLRYTRHFQQMKAVIDSGVLGEIINVSHRENVAWWHMAHSYVRGNWRNTTLSAPMILTKCCHDLDILVWLLNDRSKTLSSVGNLIHYHPHNAPHGATERCLDGCPAAASCRYYAPFIYIDHVPLWRGLADTSKGLTRWAARQACTNRGLVKALSYLIPDLKQITNYRGWPSSALTNDPTPENILAALQNGPYGRCVYYCDNDVVDHQVVSMQFEKGTS
ncbi:MAG: Gfo/Idh/MocA family oxidoreductase, partial [Anaerolineales bacterium]|nr:Gfo/Idh/MocA family oxidoreductase [Anaerolineales bacterium]